MPRNVGQAPAFALGRTGIPTVARPVDVFVQAGEHTVVVAACTGDSCWTIADAIRIALTARLREDLPKHPRHIEGFDDD